MGNRRHFAVIVLIAALTVAGTSWRRALEEPQRFAVKL